MALSATEIEAKLTAVNATLEACKEENREYRRVIADAKKTILTTRNNQKKNRGTIAKLRSSTIPKLKEQLKRAKGRAA